MSSMAKGDKGKGKTRSSFWSELFQFGLYKPTQGRIVRQLTFISIALLAVLAAYQLQRVRVLSGLFDGARYMWLVLFGVVGVWLAYRIVNFSQFADFLIAVEAEMNKVTWPTKEELWKASLVVIFVIFAMAAFLYAFDIIWTWLFQTIGIRISG